MSMWTNTKRVARYGLVGFIRNGFVSLAAVLIMTITLFVLAWILIAGAALGSVLTSLQDQVDVTVYFAPDATTDQIAQVQQEVAALPEVASTTLVAADVALSQFQARHANDQLTIQALQELGENPLGAELEVRAKDASQYGSIASYLQDQQQSASNATSAIDNINYQQNQEAIARLADIINASRTLGLAVGITLAVASLLIIFNTIRLAIYTSRDEIGVMNIVGAATWYVRGPFMVAGVLYGIVAALIVLFVMYPLTLSIGPASQNFFGTFDVYTYFTSNLATFFLAIFGAGIALGALSSFLAVRRYLKM